MSDSGAAAARRLRFERLVAPLRDDVYRYAVWLAGHPALADDVVQETMIRAYRNLDSLKDEAAIRSWLLTIARREHARHYERRRLDTRDIDSLAPADTAWLATTDDTDVADMRRALAALPADYREPLVLQVLFGFSTEEIGELMDLKRGAVLTRLHRARRKLAEIVGPGLDPGGDAHDEL